MVKSVCAEFHAKIIIFPGIMEGEGVKRPFFIGLRYRFYQISITQGGQAANICTVTFL